MRKIYAIDRKRRKKITIIKSPEPVGSWHMGHIALFGAILMSHGIVGKKKEFLKKLMYEALTPKD